MNPVFIFLVLLGAILLWFLLAFAYKPLGKVIYQIGKDAMDEINETNDTEKEKKEN